MVSYKLDKYDKYFVAFILVILVIFNIGSCFAVETEVIDGTLINGISCTPTSNVYLEGGKCTYYPCEKGYVYTIERLDDQYTRPSVFSSDIPTLNGIYTLLYTFSEDSDTVFTYSPLNNGYIVLNGNTTGVSYKISRYKVNNQSSAVSELVSNVGPQQLWSVFESGIDFIGVVVLVAFGLFLIVLLVKKLSKGKSDF